jgi:hypothetical protein
VLVLDNIDPSYETTPNIDINHSVIIANREFRILNEIKNIQKGKIIIKNEAALPLIGAELITSKKTINSFILSRFCEVF